MSSACPPSSYRCQLASQPTCGGCLGYQPCTTQGTQLCTAYNYQIQLTNCDKVINGTAQCQYQFVYLIILKQIELFFSFQTCSSTVCYYLHTYNSSLLSKLSIDFISVKLLLYL